MMEGSDERFTLLEFLEQLDAATLATWSPAHTLYSLDLLRDKDSTVYTQWKVAENELQATERLRRLAMKHEDLALAAGLAEDAASLTTVIEVYRQRCQRCCAAWERLWGHLTDLAEPGTAPATGQPRE